MYRVTSVLNAVVCVIKSAHQQRCVVITHERPFYTPYSSKFSWFEIFREIAKNHMNVNFCDKNFVIAKYFRDYLRAAAPAVTIHVVAPPTILTFGVGAWGL